MSKFVRSDANGPFVLNENTIERGTTMNNRKLERREESSSVGWERTDI